MSQNRWQVTVTKDRVKNEINKCCLSTNRCTNHTVFRTSLKSDYCNKTCSDRAMQSLGDLNIFVRGSIRSHSRGFQKFFHFSAVLFCLARWRTPWLKPNVPHYNQWSPSGAVRVHHVTDPAPPLFCFLYLKWKRKPKNNADGGLALGLNTQSWSFWTVQCVIRGWSIV